MKFSGSTFKKIFVYVIAACCLAWVMSGVRFDELLRHMRGMQLWWIPPAMMLDVLATVVHGFRWRLLVRPIASVSLLRTTQAIYTGLFTNEILPMKAGEFVRGYILSRWVGLPFVSVLPSMITERIFDGSLLVLGMGLSALFVSLPRRIIGVGVIIGTVMILIILSIVALALIERESSSAHSKDETRRMKPIERFVDFLFQFTRGLRGLWSSMPLLPMLVASVLYLFSQVVAYWMIMKANGLHLSIWVPAVVLIIVRLGSAVPNAPANIGPYQFFCVLSLTLFGIEKTRATGLAIVLSLVFMIPIMILGFIAFIRSGLTLSELRKSHRQMDTR